MIIDPDWLAGEGFVSRCKPRAVVYVGWGSTAKRETAKPDDDAWYDR